MKKKTIVLVFLSIIVGAIWVLKSPDLAIIVQSIKTVVQQIDLSSSEPNIPVPQTQQPSHYRLIGLEDNVLKGQAFLNSVEAPSLKLAGGTSQSIHYSEPSDQVDLVLTLDRQIYDLFFEDIMTFSKTKNVSIRVKKGTCGISSKELNKKSIDIGGFCCPPGKYDHLPGLKYHTLGISSIALLVHPDNMLNNISSNTARKAFSGKIRFWNQIIDEPDNNSGIVVATRLHCKTRPGHWKLLLGNDSLFSPTAREMGDIPYMFSQVSRHHAILGYETLFMMKKEGKLVKTLQVDYSDPNDLKALAEGHYPFYRVYNLTTWTGQQSKALANELVNYLKLLVEKQSEKYLMAPISELEKNGWHIKDGELVGEPGTTL